MGLWNKQLDIREFILGIDKEEASPKDMQIMRLFLLHSVKHLPGHLQGEPLALSVGTAPLFCSPEDGGAPAAG